ncbi:hypothetical protein OS493_004894 [Desmophyllum pertusum]|uniref:Uncharacterized protein n=1 Tax=Desmophyllum pertusum TaxID=174260 RepID=A0A9W9Z3Z0_9CNID|nr:hypothetical protein OS493_004894 [Desmophyllum pertusum]
MGERRKQIRRWQSGVVIISWDNGTIMESHLLVAVTCNERRGSYTCVVFSQDGETRQTFVIEGQTRKELKDIDYIAIGVGIGITLSMFAAIIYFLIRGSRRLKEGKLERMSRFAVNYSQENEAIEEETSNANNTPPKIPELLRT